MDGVEYACSGSTVGGAVPSVVVTAAHCVSDGSGGWARNWTFVPGYANGRAPYGAYAAVTYYVAAAWVDGANENDDIAFVVTRPLRARPPAGAAAASAAAASAGGGPAGGGLPVGEMVGEQPITFGPRGAAASVFGYPAVKPYTGGQLDYCAGHLSPDPYGGADAGLPCAMTEGDSGGPWLSDFDARTGTGVITGVTSFKYSGQSRNLYSANLGVVAQALYTRAERP